MIFFLILGFLPVISQAEGLFSTGDEVEIEIVQNESLHQIENEPVRTKRRSSKKVRGGYILGNQRALLMGPHQKQPVFYTLDKPKVPVKSLKRKKLIVTGMGLGEIKAN